jgi:hypothetical protein
MAATRQLSKFDRAKSGVEARGPTGTQLLAKFELDGAGAQSSARPRASHDGDEEPVAVGDRLTPVDTPLPSREASSSISIPAPAIEIEMPPPTAPADRRPTPADPGALKTRLAQKFSTLADTVNERFVDFHIGGGNWGLELTSPEGMSTAAGKQALQHLRMRPRRAGYPVLVAGVVNPIEGTAELRDYAHISSIHTARFGRPLDIADAEWEQLLRRCEVVLKGSNIAVARTAPGPELAPPVRASRSFGAKVGIAIGAAAMVATIAWWVFAR